jgi:hypothetical protein
MKSQSAAASRIAFLWTHRPFPPRTIFTVEAGAEVRIDILVNGRAHADGIWSADLPFQIEQCFGKDGSPAGRDDANGNLH